MIYCLNTNRQMWSANSTQRIRNRALRNVDRATRRAFTLVELLIVIVVIAILSSMVIMALTTTMASAKEVHTRATITKLHDLIMQKYESYQTRRVPLTISGSNRIDVKDGSGNIITKGTAHLRLDALRDLMRMEMPDRFSDFTYSTGEPSPLPAGTIDASTKKSTLTGLAIPAVTKYYRNRVVSAPVKTTQFESAECLYLIIAYGLQDQEALERFSESEIGDTDEDGAPEFIDAWGRPISFMRWAPLFGSEAQFPSDSRIPNLRTSYPPTPADRALLAQYHHDPFDPLKQDAGAYALFPLIYSGGPDKIYDVDETTRAASLSNKPFDTSSTLAGQTMDLSSSPSDGEDNSTDNITNHELLVP